MFLLYILRFAFPYRDSRLGDALSRVLSSFFFLSQSLSSCTMRIKHKMKHSLQMSFTEQFQHRYKSLIEPFGIKRRKINSMLFFPSFDSNRLHNSSAILLRFVFLLLCWQFPIMLVFHFIVVSSQSSVLSLSNGEWNVGPVKKQRLISKGNIKIMKKRISIIFTFN